SAAPVAAMSWGRRRTLLTALLVHLAVRLATLGAVVAAAAVHHGAPGGLGARVGAALGKSDGVWYLGIAHHGYGPPPPIGPDGVYTHLTSLAFFPLYPLLVRAVAVLGVPYLGAALVVTAVAGAAAAVLIAEWARPLAGDAGAVLLVAVWAVLPSSVVLDMAYSEALFVAAAAGCLLALQRERWLTAAAAVILAGLTRPTAGPLLLALWVAVALHHRHRWRIEADRSARTADHPPRPVLPRAVVAALLAPVGLVISLAHVAAVTGRVDGWFWLERTVWRSGFDGGWSALQHYGELFTGGRTAHRLPEVVSAVAVAAAVALVVVAWRRRLPAAPMTYAVAAAALAVGERGYFYVKPRLLFVCFPLLVPLSRWLVTVPWRWLAAGAVPVVVASLAYNAYLLVGWPKAL
ncbi:MAG TPA: hypothetical protein VFT62_00295, partial [Mycobacteriales bacterium]|nr:hypothetical protein [Mycobacteriales bacterium]